MAKIGEKEAQPVKSFTLEMTPAEVDQTYRALATQPFGDVAPLIEKLKGQVITQNAAAAAKPGAPSAPAIPAPAAAPQPTAPAPVAAPSAEVKP
jgi:hypothetical protein